MREYCDITWNINAVVHCGRMNLASWCCTIFSVQNFSVDKRKRSFCRAGNSVFTVGRVASEEVTMQLFNSKHLPVLFYGLVVRLLSKSEASSIDFLVYLFQVLCCVMTDKFEPKFSLRADLVKALV